MSEVDNVLKAVTPFCLSSSKTHWSMNSGIAALVATTGQVCIQGNPLAI